MSWLPQMEASVYTFYNNKGVAEDCFEILKGLGINTIKLRTFVNPSENKFSRYCSKDETATMAARAKKWGMKVMVDFHYSDSWADPKKQNKPAVWAKDDFPHLLNEVYKYTLDVKNTIKAAGVTPDWVEVGNEITNGMLWPDLLSLLA
ncbi:MAG TPA: glycosyl hydrolase 53 family protein [Hanamia sp.]